MSSEKKSLQLFDISKYKAEIYGISIFWIMLFHAHPMFGVDYTLGRKEYWQKKNYHLLRKW